jgi:hypothetical protein
LKIKKILPSDQPFETVDGQAYLTEIQPGGYMAFALHEALHYSTALTIPILFVNQGREIMGTVT